MSEKALVEVRRVGKDWLVIGAMRRMYNGRFYRYIYARHQTCLKRAGVAAVAAGTVDLERSACSHCGIEAPKTVRGHMNLMKLDGSGVVSNET